MSYILRFVVIALALALVSGPVVGPPGFVADGSTQAQPSAPVLPPPEPDTLVLVYPEQQITDTAQAQVTQFVAAVVPPETWPTIERQPDESLQALVDRVYDYYQRGPYAKPETASAIARAIVEHNESVAAGTPLRVPPLPVRGHGRYEAGESLRVYDTQSVGYAMRQEFQAFGAATAATSEQQQSRVVSELKAQRAATTTALTISVHDVRAAFRDRGGLPMLPPDVVPVSARRNDAGEVEDIGFSTIEFMTTATDAPQTSSGVPCDAGPTWLTTSSYRSLAMHRLTDEVRMTLAAKAEARPLVLFDFDFTGFGHGSKVRSVVDVAMDSLGVALGPGVRTVDFLVHDADEKEELGTTLTAFIDSLGPRDPRREYEAAARRWIEHESDQVIFGAYRIHDLVLQALFWKHLRGPSVVNMSFRLQSPAMRILAPRFLTDQPSAFAIIAAGNESVLLGPEWVPQDAPLTVANAINVTHGLLDGTILGTRSADGNPFRGVVSLLGPGCGFSSGAVVASDSGSSLAAPYIAVAAWLKYLLDDEAGAGLRRSMLRAVEPVPTQVDGIEAVGIFDPARLLAGVGPHLRLRDGAIVPIAEPLLAVQCDGAPSDIWQHFTPRDDAWQSVMLIKKADRFRAWSREIEATRDVSVRTRHSCLLVNLRFTAGALKFNSLDEFAQAVSELVM